MRGFMPWSGAGKKYDDRIKPIANAYAPHQKTVSGGRRLQL